MSKPKPRGIRRAADRTEAEKDRAAELLADAIADRPYRLPGESRKPQAPVKDQNARRGKWAKDPETGQRIDLGGRDLELRLNAWEVERLTAAAQAAGLSLTTFVRSQALRAAAELLDV